MKKSFNLNIFLGLIFLGMGIFNLVSIHKNTSSSTILAILTLLQFVIGLFILPYGAYLLTKGIGEVLSTKKLGKEDEK